MSNFNVINYKTFEFEDSDVFFLDFEAETAEKDAMLTREEAFDLLNILQHLQQADDCNSFMQDNDAYAERYNEICELARQRALIQEDDLMYVCGVYVERLRTNETFHVSLADI